MYERTRKSGIDAILAQQNQNLYATLCLDSFTMQKETYFHECLITDYQFLHMLGISLWLNVNIFFCTLPSSRKTLHFQGQGYLFCFFFLFLFPFYNPLSKRKMPVLSVGGNGFLMCISVGAETNIMNMHKNI